MNDEKCQIKGCKNTGALPDHDGKMKCQEHLAESMFKKRPVKNIIEFSRNAPCPCESGLKAKKCCLDKNNKNRQWLLQRIGRVVYYKEMPPCAVPNCKECNRAKEGIRIDSPKHARIMDEYCKEHNTEFVDIKPNYDDLEQKLK